MKSVKKLNKIKVFTALAVVPLISLFIYPAVSNAATTVNQGTTTSYGILAASTVTNTGATTVSGTAGSEVGVSPGSSIVPGSGSFTTGTQHSNDSFAIAAQTALTTAFNDVNGATGTQTIASELGGQTLTAGSYTAAPSFANHGILTFNAEGNPNAQFIMKTPSSTVTTYSGSSMVLENGAQACNVFWAIGSSATLSATAAITATSAGFVGHLYAYTDITLNTGATVRGNLLARGGGGVGGAVTLDTNTITNDNCAPAVVVVAVPAPLQTSSITSVAPANCVLTGTTAVTINGVFPALVTNVTVNGVAVAVGSWTQTATTVTVNVGTSSTVPTVIQLYNGQAPVLAAQTFTCTPVAVVIPTPTPTPVITPVATGTIHVVKTVVNGYGGTATAADFSLSLRHHGVDVLGSPDVGMAAPGRTYVLAPGTYVVSEGTNPAFPNYISSFSIVGQTSNDIVLASGADLTVIETNTQLPAFAPVVATPVVVKTVTGGKLPKTGSPWYNMLLLSTGLVLLGGVVARFGKTVRNK